jgi:hypothetical protein
MKTQPKRRASLPSGYAALAQAKRARAVALLQRVRMRVHRIEIVQLKQKPRLKRAPAKLHRSRAVRSLQLPAAGLAKAQSVLPRTAACPLRTRATPATTRTPAPNRSLVQLGHRRQQLQGLVVVVRMLVVRAARAARDVAAKPAAVVTRAEVVNQVAAVVTAGAAPRRVEVVPVQAARIASSSCP